MSRPGYAARAAAGAEFLDGQEPGWALRVDPAVLDMASERHDILGQLGGDYTVMRDRLGLSSRRSVRLGFSLGPETTWEDQEARDELEAAWIREIATRREAGQAAP